MSALRWLTRLFEDHDGQMVSENLARAVEAFQSNSASEQRSWARVARALSAYRAIYPRDQT